jgi:hypothetical protein
MNIESIISDLTSSTAAKGVAMDPASAISAAITAAFVFLGTPAGQKFALDQIAIGEKFNIQIADFFTHIHNQVTAAPAVAPVKASA